MKASVIIALGCLVAAVSGCGDWANSLTLHNQHRAKHQAPTMTWNTAMASQAAAWSATLVNSSSCWLQHSTSSQRNNNGENLYAVWGSTTPSCSAATTAFYNEVSKYVFTSTPWTTNGPNFAQIGHFTQVVWKSSIQLGCGSAVSASGCYVITCRYSPAGNYVGDAQFLANVLPPANTPTSPSPPPPPPSPSPKPSPPPKASPPPAPPSPPSSCKDNSAYPCSWAATSGYCTWFWTNGPKVSDTCPASCNTCPAGRRMALDSTSDIMGDVSLVTQQQPRATSGRKELLRGRVAQQVVVHPAVAGNEREGAIESEKTGEPLLNSTEAV